MGEIIVTPVRKTHVPEDMYDVEYTETRYVIADKETGKVLDDAQGYGYKTRQKAYAAWNYKHRDRSKDAEKAAKRKVIQKWLKEHSGFRKTMDRFAFEIAKGSWGPEDKFDAALAKKMLVESGYTDLPFTAGELLREWRR